ncbi:MAG TPA: hypothetical protein VFB38_17495 [Chthonomonadaceae bacterium]|nr:hypothetical protein [Chthonomonadaceae bacterium]
MDIMGVVWPILAGWGFWWFSGKCRGRNARNAFRYLAWGAWLWLLVFIWMPIPFYFILKFVPSLVCVWLAALSMLKEMRAQQKGEYTDAA